MHLKPLQKLHPLDFIDFFAAASIKAVQHKPRIRARHAPFLHVSDFGHLRFSKLLCNFRPLKLIGSTFVNADV